MQKKIIKCLFNAHIQLNDPQEGDEEQVERHKETEGAPDIRDGLALFGRYKQVRGRDGQGRRVGSVQGGDGREAAIELAVLSARHSCSETGNSPCNKVNETVIFSATVLLGIICTERAFNIHQIWM